MNKKDYIDTLRQSLYGLSDEEINEIIYDYEEHFSIGLERGKTEEEIIKELGDPKNIAKSYKASVVIEEAKKNPTTTNILKAILATLSLGFFNLVFVLGPFIGLLGLLIGLYGGAIGVTAGGIGLIFEPIFPFFINVSFFNIHPGAQFFIGLGMTCFGLLFFILDIYISKFLYNITVKYLRWNLSIIKK